MPLELPPRVPRPSVWAVLRFSVLVVLLAALLIVGIEGAARGSQLGWWLIVGGAIGLVVNVPILMWLAWSRYTRP